MDSLVIITKRFTKEFKITTEEITIGRSLDNTLCLNDETISRGHAVIVRRNGIYHIRDCGSYNGTIINGNAVPPNQEIPLADKDNIVLGDYKLICKFASEDSGGGDDGSDTDMTANDFDLDEITGDSDDQIPSIDFGGAQAVPDHPLPGAATRKTVRTAALTEEQLNELTSKPAPTIDPFQKASTESQIAEIKQLANRATIQHIPALNMNDLDAITADPPPGSSCSGHSSNPTCGHQSARDPGIQRPSHGRDRQ